MKMKILKDFPSPREFFIETPLYHTVNLKGYDVKKAFEIEYFDETIDSHCIECDRQGVFRGKSSHYMNLHAYQPNYLDDGEFEVVLNCTRNNDHSMHFYFVKRKGLLLKVGQTPSLADLATSDIEKYRKVLGNKYSEFTRAIGLAANGIGIGSYSYFRRVFYDLIDRAHERAGDDLISKEEFQTLKVKDKIKTLKDYLPKVMVKNANIYSILSIGIHELDEEECIKYYKTLKTGIELILDEEIHRIEHEIKTKEITDEIGRISGNLK